MYESHSRRHQLSHEDFKLELSEKVIDVLIDVIIKLFEKNIDIKTGRKNGVS